MGGYPPQRDENVAAPRLDSLSPRLRGGKGWG